MVLRDAGPQRLAHARHAGLTDRNGDRHAGDLPGRLDGAGPFQHPLPAHDFQAVAEQRLETDGAQTVDRKALAAATLGLNYLCLRASRVKRTTPTRGQPAS